MSVEYQSAHRACWQSAVGAYDVHDGQDVGGEAVGVTDVVVLAVVLRHLLVNHHQGLHVSLPADRARFTSGTDELMLPLSLSEQATPCLQS